MHPSSFPFFLAGAVPLPVPPSEHRPYYKRKSAPPKDHDSPLSRQSEKFLIGQSRKFLLTAVRLKDGTNRDEPTGGLLRSPEPAVVEGNRKIGVDRLISTPGKPGARFFCPKPQLGSFTVSNGLSKTKGPLRRPVKTTRIVIAVGGPGADCFRSQLRRLGFGQPLRARPRCGCANIPCGPADDPQNRNFLLGWQ